MVGNRPIFVSIGSSLAFFLVTAVIRLMQLPPDSDISSRACYTSFELSLKTPASIYPLLKT